MQFYFPSVKTEINTKLIMKIKGASISKFVLWSKSLKSYYNY